jgi:hypothetical protein
MTEAEAIVKLCPLKSNCIVLYYKCEASKCMLWRWDIEQSDDNSYTVQSEINGHCGIGG